MYQFKKWLSIALILTVFSCNANSNEQSGSADSTIQWMTFEEAVKRAETDKNPKNIFIDFYTHWCGWCKVMDKQTFADPNVAKLMNKYFYPVKFDAESKEPITFKGQKYGFVASGRNGYHELAANIMQGKLSYPTFIFLNPKFEIITPISGFVKPEEFEPIVNFLGQNLYMQPNGGNWEEYRKNYKRGQQ
ncbi:MAG: DUF255 domain-containing protein [Chitinophagales bacterium]|nr:DUF255 domain-containing protein [Chitinophagales bacterium]